MQVVWEALQVVPSGGFRGHLQQEISLLLLDPYVVPLYKAVQLKWRAMIDFQLTPSPSFARFLPSDVRLQAFNVAISQGDLVLLKRLFDYNRVVPPNPLVQAARDRHRFRQLMQHPFHFAAAISNLEIVEWFCQHERYPCHPVALAHAAVNGHAEVVKCQVREGLTQDIGEAIQEALAENHLATVPSARSMCALFDGQGAQGRPR